MHWRRLLVAGLCLLLLVQVLAEAQGKPAEKAKGKGAKGARAKGKAKASAKVSTVVSKRGDDSSGDFISRKWNSGPRNLTTVVLQNINHINNGLEVKKRRSPITQKIWDSLSIEERQRVDDKEFREIAERNRRQMQEAMERTVRQKRQEEAEKNNISLKGLCTLSLSCATGWRSKGVGAILIHDSKFRQNPFRRGPPYNDKWTWSAAKICCANTEKTAIRYTSTFQRSCTKGMTTEALTALGTSMKDKAPFIVGTAITDTKIAGAIWTHPYLCGVKDLKTLRGTNGCLIARKCPTHSNRRWIDSGLAAILVKKTLDESPFPLSSSLGKKWSFANARFCCLAV